MFEYGCFVYVQDQSAHTRTRPPVPTGSRIFNFQFKIRVLVTDLRISSDLNTDINTIIALVVFNQII
jgi:hypothetical protein